MKVIDLNKNDFLVIHLCNEIGEPTNEGYFIEIDFDGELKLRKFKLHIEK